MGSKRNLLDHAGFAGRHLADDRDENRITPMRDGGHLHRHVEIFERHMPVTFAKRTFGLKQLAIDQAFDDNFCIGRNIEIHASPP